MAIWAIRLGTSLDRAGCTSQLVAHAQQLLEVAGLLLSYREVEFEDLQQQLLRLQYLFL